MSQKIRLLNGKCYNFYIQKTKKLPLLSKKEEYILTKKFKETNDINAAKKLIESNINYVIKIAKNYLGYKIIIKDLIQEGIIGLIKALKHFDPEKNYRLISFAIYWIKAEIHDYIIKNLKIFKIATTKTQKKLFFNLRKIKKFKNLTLREKEIISNLFNMKFNEINIMELKLNQYFLSLENIHEYIKYENTEQNPLYLLEHQNWSKHLKENIKKALSKLDIRSQKIIEKRWLSENKNTLKFLALKYKISSERIRQLESKAIKKLKEEIQNI